MSLSVLPAVIEPASRAVDRLSYYFAGLARYALPWTFTESQRAQILDKFQNGGFQLSVMDRVNYYNNLPMYSPSLPETPLNQINRSKSRYAIDTYQYVRYFPKTLNIDYLFGDIQIIPPTATIVKSRPIHGDNRNSVLLNLDKFRHFRTFRDTIPWNKKLPMAVWRGSMNNPLRIELVQKHQNSRFANVGTGLGQQQSQHRKPYLTPFEQFRYRYILSIEGCDVATNLKWIMASKSVCLMPKSRYETWFMEGRLKAGHHFIELKDDFSDLEEKIDSLEADPEMATFIVENANSYVKNFKDIADERLVSLLILQKYFEATGQLSPSPFTSRFFG